jgi:hypothetical protein
MIRAALAMCFLVFFSTNSWAAPPELTGQWSGYWVSEHSGHSGPLRGKFVPLDAETYRVRFSGRFARVIPFVYSTKMHVSASGDDVLVLNARQNLGPFGTFQTTATATATDFNATFTSRADTGRFVLTRRK